MRIDEPISFRWPYEWHSENMSTRKPVVNVLLKALIEENYLEIKRLYEQENASLLYSDEGTLARIIYEKLNNYKFIEFLLRNQLITSFIGMPGSLYLKCCYGPDGYSWNLLARAGILNAYDVMDLLARYRFGGTSYCIGGEGYELEDHLFRHNDITGFKVLHENGATKCEFNSSGEYLPWLMWRRKYPNSKVTSYISAHPIPKRKSLGLDSDAFYKITSPALEKEGVFGKKSARYRNEMRIKDCEDRIRAQNNYLDWLESKGLLQEWLDMERKRAQTPWRL